MLLFLIIFQVSETIVSPAQIPLAASRPVLLRPSPICISLGSRSGQRWHLAGQMLESVEGSYTSWADIYITRLQVPSWFGSLW